MTATKYQDGLHKQIKVLNNKTHTLLLKLAIYSKICLVFYLYPELFCGVPCIKAMFTLYPIALAAE